MKTMASGPITSWEIDGETVETVSDFIFWGSKITADGDCSHEIKRRLLLGRKVMTNLDSIFKSRDSFPMFCQNKKLKPHLPFFYSGSGINHFFKELWFFLMEKAVYVPTVGIRWVCGYHYVTDPRLFQWMETERMSWYVSARFLPFFLPYLSTSS